MVAHLSNSPDFVHVPFERIMAEQELRDVRRRFRCHAAGVSCLRLLPLLHLPLFVAPFLCFVFALNAYVRFSCTRPYAN